MTAPPRRRRARRRSRVPVPLVLALVGILVFLLGIALGEALHDNPRPGRMQTIVRTLTR